MAAARERDPSTTKIRNSGPVRTCVGCRAKRPQDELVRVVSRRGEPPVVERSRDRAQGRGAYVCLDLDCVERALKSGGLRRALRCAPLSEEFATTLRSIVTREGSHG